MTLTDGERDLLRRNPGLIEFAVAEPKPGIDYLRGTSASGGGMGFNYAVDNNRLTGWWKHYEVLKRDSEGRPSLLRFEEPHREVSITLARLQKWAESLPADVRARARVAWSTKAGTRDLEVLRHIVLEAIDCDVPGQLDLFGGVA